MRVVAGIWRGRRLSAPRGTATRPTADRVREALFSILFDVEGMEVLDVFAGTGAIGIEAVSRGARRATFVEHARAALDVLTKNVASLGADRSRFEVRRTRAARALDELAAEGRTFDLIFADPPYAEAAALLEDVLPRAARILAPGGTIVLELAHADDAPRAPQGLRCTRTKRYGETELAFYERVEVMQLTRRSATVAPSATLALAQKARELAAEGKDVVSLTTGEPDFPPPEHVREAMKRAIDDGRTRYTAVNGVPELREAIAAAHARPGITWDPADVIVSTGAKQSIFNAVMALVEDGDEGIVCAPYWLSYVDMIRFAGGKVVTLETREEDGFILDPGRLAAAITDRTRVFFLNSPSNPAGALYDADQLRAIAGVLARHPQITIIADEIYDCFVYGGRSYTSLLDVAPELKERTVVINGCSKRYAMTGLRLGWALGPRPLISAMARIQGAATSNANAVSQAGALAALTGDQAPVREMIEAFDVRRRFVMGRLGGIPGVTCFDPRGAFYALPNVSAFVGRTLPDGSRADDAYSITAHMLHEYALVVVPGGPFGAPNHFRISFAADMDTLAKGLERARKALLDLR